jgi:hypothetical protein
MYFRFQISNSNEALTRALKFGILKFEIFDNKEFIIG